jgi:hypothetical protein
MYRNNLPILMLVVTCAVLTAGYSHHLSSPPILIDSAFDFIRSEREQRYPAAAFDGTNWLVVWQDNRDDNPAIWGARVSSAGVLLDSANICIADDRDSRFEPSVAFNGTCFLVVWSDRRNPGYDIYGARVLPDGTVLDPEGIPICRNSGYQRHPAVASLNSEFLVVWDDTRNSGTDEDIYAARITGTGQVLDTNGIPVATVSLPQQYPSVTARTNGYLVVWQDERNGTLTDEDIYAARLAANGTVLDTNGIPVSSAAGGQYYPATAYDGTNCLVVWEDYRNDNGDIYGARVSNNGTVLDPNGVGIHISPNYWQGDPALLFTGSNYFVVWEDDSLSGGNDCNILGARVTPGGVVLDPEGIIITSGQQYYPAVAPGSSGLLAVWEDYRDGEDGDIYACDLTPDGSRVDSIDVLISNIIHAYEQHNPATAFDGTNFLTVWVDDWRGGLTGSSKLRGARISRSGVLLDPGGFQILERQSLVGPPAVAFGISSYLVVLNPGSNYSVIGVRISPAGTIIDTFPISLPLSGIEGSSPAVAFDGTNWLAAAAFRDWSGNYCVAGVRIAPNGTVLDTSPVQIYYGPGEVTSPALVFGDSCYLVVWSGWSGTSYHIYGARIRTDGMVPGSPFRISPATGIQSAPSVAFDGTNWLVTWQDRRSPVTDESLYCARVTQAGMVLDTSGIPLNWCPRNYEDPLQIGFDGSTYFGVWQQDNYSRGELQGIRISPAGSILDSFSVYSAYEYQGEPALALAQSEPPFIAYAGYVANLRGYQLETVRIWAGFYPLIAINQQADPPAVSNPGQPVTIVRNLLFWLPAPGKLKTAFLLDITGRKVMRLTAGNNDVRGLAAGLYFIQQERELRKVVVTR